MPIYAYRCAACGHAKDVLQKLSDAPLSQCPACGAPSFAKQVTAAGFQLKGSGWYVTDFRGGSNNAAAKDGAKEGAKSGADGGADKPAAESKTADAPAAKTAEKKADKAADKPAATPTAAPAKSSD
jgi:putative FmdB family regulatory protein